MLKTEQEIQAWLLTKEARERLQQASDEAEAACVSYREAARVDSATLDKSMTI